MNKSIMVKKERLLECLNVRDLIQKEIEKDYPKQCYSLIRCGYQEDLFTDNVIVNFIFDLPTQLEWNF